jgi:predicted amidohydrolase
VVFNARYQAKNVATPVRSVLASVLWFDGKGKQIEQTEFPVSWPEKDGQGWVKVTGTYRVPEKASEAQLEVRLRWAAGGEVAWKDVELKKTEAPAARKVKVAAVNHRPRGTKSARENLEQFAKFVDEAGKEHADIICLPEGITVCGNGKTYAQVAEPIPGPATEFLGECAKRNHAYVVAGVYEREGKMVYNTAVLLGRDGKLMGKYRKVCLPREEIDGGITPGTEYPVFDTDFGRIGMMICWDVSYPEVARELSARGAEMIFMPIWGGNETLAKARAIENQVYVVASGYDFRTAIYDKAGEEMAKAGEGSGIVYSEMDLNQRLMWPWLGDWRARIWREGPARMSKAE